MAVRTDLRIDWHLSPRLITVLAPSTELTLQDLVDTLRVEEARVRNSTYDHLVDASGKEDLGGSVFVGITAELQNAKVAFEARTTPAAVGTITTTNAAGTTVIDTNALFVSSGVEPGATVVNHTTGLSGTVLSVDSETQLTTEETSGGSPAGWSSGDSYAVHNVEQCNISGGNLVAVDSAGSSVDPVFPTAYTQIVRTSSSSATLQELQDIQYASFNGGVWYDATNGTAGTAFPTGTERQPSSNFTDVLSIADTRGFDSCFVKGDATIDSGLSFVDFTFIGASKNKSTLTISAAADVTNSEFLDATITGTLDGGNVIRNCQILTLNFIDGFIEQCVLGNATITLSGAGDAHFLDCWSAVIGAGMPTIDMAGSGSGLALWNYNGGIKIANKTGSESVSIDMNSGQVVLASTVTAGTIVARGVGKLIDESGDHILTGTWNGVTIINEMMSVEQFWGRVIQGETAENLMGIFAAALGGKSSGADGEAGNNTVAYRDLLDTKAVITALVDEFGNRASVTLDP